MHKEIPDQITIPFITGDGIGTEIMNSTQAIMEHAVHMAHHGSRTVQWKEIYAGGKSYQKYGEYLPQETIEILRKYRIGIKGPLTTPVGGGFSSLNVALRKELDLYSCIRPVKWFRGLPSPLKHPEAVDVIIFRENSEDLYAGIEFPVGSDGNSILKTTLEKSFPDEYAKLPFTQEVGFDIKPISKQASQRIMRAAIHWAISNQRKKITIVHKGNIMKYTEGAFRTWAYEVAEQEFKDSCYSKKMWSSTLKEKGSEKANDEKAQAIGDGKIFVDDLIADNAFAKAITNPGDFDMVVTPNLNGDYLSDAFAALAGGIGISPGANINHESDMGLFEANHGSAEDIAGMDKANPSSLILSGAMLFDFIGWKEAASLMRAGVVKTIQSGNVPADLHSQLKDSHLVGCADFSHLIIENMK